MAQSTKWSHAEFGCVTFADNLRTYTYHKWAQENALYPLECCPAILDCSCVNDDPLIPYVDPITDVAPWYDPSLPESGEFLGMMIMKVTGARNSTFTREVVDAFGDGSILGRPRLRGRSFVLEGLVIGTSCAGVDYGLEFLRRVFEDEVCACSPSDPCSACSGRQFTLRVFCGDAEPCDNGIRTWDSTGTVDGIQVIDDDDLSDCCCVVRKVTLTIQTESPYSFNCADELCSVDADPDAFTACFDWESDCLDCNPDTSCCDRCGYDALCTCYPISDPELTVLENDCFCMPLQRTIQCCCIDEVGQGFDTALKLDIYSGDNDTDLAFTDLGLRNLTIKVYDNPDNLPCITDQESLDDWCNIEPRFQLQVAYVPSDATLTIDGRRERITLQCDDVCRPYSQVVTNTEGAIFPFVTRCDPMMVCIEFDTLNTQFETAPAIPTHVTVSTFRRWFN